MSIGEIIRDKYSKDLERKTRNVFFLCSSTRGADYYVFIGNNNSVYISKKDDSNKAGELQNILHKSKTEGKFNFGYKSKHFNTDDKNSNINTNKFGNKVETKVEEKFEIKPNRSNASSSQDSKKVVMAKKYQSSRYNK